MTGWLPDIIDSTTEFPAVQTLFFSRLLFFFRVFIIATHIKPEQKSVPKKKDCDFYALDNFVGLNVQEFGILALEKLLNAVSRA